MKTFFSFLLLILISIHTSGQFKTVRFEILDKLTSKPVSGIKALPDFTGDSAASNEKGLLIIKVPKGYKDTITLYNAEYYPMALRIIPVAPGKSIAVYMIHRPSNTDSVTALEGINNRTATGKVYHYYQGQMLDSVGIRLEDDMILGYTDSKGEYFVSIPRTVDSLYLTLDGFQTAKVSGRKSGSYGLVPVNPADSDICRVQWKNVLSFSPFELARGGIGLRYERFISQKQSVGLHVSSYFFNETHYRKALILFWETDVLVIEEFDGVKLAPFYRYYMKRYIRGGVYAEVKPVAGYFHFPELIGYSEKPIEFWSFGIGGSIGFMKVTSKKHLTTNFSFGGQYLPIKDPREVFDISNDHGWWYGLGPGSIIEFKLTFGGLF